MQKFPVSTFFACADSAHTANCMAWCRKKIQPLQKAPLAESRVLNSKCPRYGARVGGPKTCKKQHFYKFYSMSQSCNWKPILYKWYLMCIDLFKQLNAILISSTKYSVKLLKCFTFVWYVIPLVLVGAILLLCAHFQRVDYKKHQQNWRSYVPFMLLDIILDQWWLPVASSEALDLLHCMMRAVSYRCPATAIKMASKVGACFHHCFVCCRSSGCWGNTERVVAQWWHPVASRVALDMLHWVMHTS